MSSSESSAGYRGAVQQRSQAGIQQGSPTISSEDRKHTSGGVFVAVDSNLRAVKMQEEEEAVESIPGNQGRIAQARVNVRRGKRVFRVLLALRRLDSEE